MTQGLKFRIQKVEGLYFLCSENIGADQLRVYCKADLRLCLRISKNPFFSQQGSYVTSIDLLYAEKIAGIARSIFLQTFIKNYTVSLYYICHRLTLLAC